MSSDKSATTPTKEKFEEIEESDEEDIRFMKEFFARKFEELGAKPKYRYFDDSDESEESDEEPYVDEDFDDDDWRLL
jgi:hypothetical protein